MKNKLLLISLLLFFGFCFVVLLKGLNNPNAYVPETTVGKTIANFTARDLYTEKEISFDEIFIDSKFPSFSKCQLLIATCPAKGKVAS